MCVYLKEFPETMTSPYESSCTHKDNETGICCEMDCPLEEGDPLTMACKRPGRNGCGHCPLCEEWGDMEYQRRKDGD